MSVKNTYIRVCYGKKLRTNVIVFFCFPREKKKEREMRVFSSFLISILGIHMLEEYAIKKIYVYRRLKFFTQSILHKTRSARYYELQC